MEITKGARTDLDKARAIYEWIVENTFREPKTPGCGLGDIRFMLESKDLGGKCADLNGLYVGLARASGLPARDVYGISVGKSELGYKSLGTAFENACWGGIAGPSAGGQAAMPPALAPRWPASVRRSRSRLRASRFRSVRWHEDFSDKRLDGGGSRILR